ncbi:hypothetical protein [Aequorivita echinoideorum]|uniref:Uncharacterized protein n=1 Tax=Aequorivita echinoideorum TaxID=1549647 RepID=A0ABS5S8D4_9FLAO|nr:hypothetical protein [Aequorivita echinoideorum]MBT0609243.1 hypothetical protein [Aequorivita echinoideorum]
MANVNLNRINEVLDPAVMTEVLGHVTSIDGNLPPITLTDAERASLGAISVANKVFVEEVLDELTNGNFPPLDALVDNEAVRADLQLFEQMETLESRLESLLNKVRDIKRVAGHECYGSGTTVYGMLGVMAKSGIPGAQQSYDRLSARYQRQPGGRPMDQNVS